MEWLGLFLLILFLLFGFLKLLDVLRPVLFEVVQTAHTAEFDFPPFVSEDVRVAHAAELFAVGNAGLERIGFGFVSFRISAADDDRSRQSAGEQKGRRKRLQFFHNLLPVVSVTPLSPNTPPRSKSLIPFQKSSRAASRSSPAFAESLARNGSSAGKPLGRSESSLQNQAQPYGCSFMP